ncbi:hypothetical protein CVT25_006657 [Psilocybe cyanescens]|uniref:F-box domain-containing protein n=1 Tax=Psilocybe cyanescens TaxID=93625 RepID=A0A409XU62_PSICY|nr:hypothetical protein CVT25_006657 [Psilocybe cyanescens]
MPSGTKPSYIVDLPFEIWQHVSSFLSVEEVWVLHGLNRMLRNIALDKRYKCVKVNFAPRHYGSYATRFRHLGEDQIAKRVREIYFQPYIPLDPFDLKDDLKARSPLKGIFEETSAPDANTIVSTIARFKKVSSLRIESTYDIRLRPPGLQLIHGGLRIFANNLRTLILSFPLEMMSTIILPDLVLTRLETLEIMPSSLEWSTRQASWMPYNPRVITYFKLIPLFEGLNHIPHLESVSFSVPAHTSPKDATYRFFAQHSKTLRRLQLSMAHMSVLDYQNFLEQLDVPLPLLEALTLNFGFRSRHLIVDPSLPKFLSQYASTLRSLRLLKKQHGKREMFSLFEIPLGSPTAYSKLRFLEIWLYCLTPEILDMISSSLPNLEDLELTVRIFKGESASFENERDQFCVEMRLRDYYEWKLRRLLLKNIDSKTMSRSNANCIIAVVEALPRLLTINEMNRVDYLSCYSRT